MEGSVVPAIIPESFEDLTKKVELVKDYAQRVQIDVFDGTFSPSINWPYNNIEDEDFKKLKMGALQLPYSDELLFEIDVTLTKPEDHIEDWIRAGARALIVHVESTENMQNIIDKCRKNNVSVGLALSPKTPNETLFEWISKVDVVQFMGNEKVGYHGVSLDESVLLKIQDLHKKYPALTLAIDIGVTQDTAPELVRAGITRLVSGSSIFKSENPEQAIQAFHAILNTV